jgi:hypothetical protein
LPESGLKRFKNKDQELKVAGLLKKFKWLIFLLGFLLVLFILAKLIFGIFGRQIVVDQIQKNLNTTAKLKSIDLSLPLRVHLSQLEIGTLVKIKQVSISINPLGFFAGKLVINNLDLLEPEITLLQSAPGKFNLPVPKQTGGKPPDIYLAGLQIKNGKVIFTDKTVTSADYELIVDKINLNLAKDIFPPTSLNMRFDFSADFTDKSGGALGSLFAKGWVDMAAKNMDAKLELKGLEVAQFAPYYGNFISHKKISTGKLDLTSLFKAKDNQLEITNNLRLFALVYGQQNMAKDSFEELSGLDITQNTLDLFADESGNLDFEFTINTLLDKPALDPNKVKGIILNAAMKNLANQSPVDLASKVLKTVEKIKNFTDGLKSIGN